MDSLSTALEQMKANGGIEEEEELRTHLDTLLRALEENREGAAEQIVASSILPSLAAILRRDTSLTAQATLVTAELAKNAEVREPCIQAGFEVVKAVTRVEGMQHLITMATNEHVIMQNEALVALAIASTIDIDTVEEPFMSAGLLSTLQQMLEDPVAVVEVKFSTVGLVCSLANSVELRSQMEALALRETLGKLSNHGNTKLASQADTALSILAETS
ncbi:Rap1 GTPase-GDP dissociation stimulator 1-A [Acipenser ruthenus]|uniref:Rap1 GTPase-GDP dissociation stimulator 1-A n=1 Tax=Acipenser ruthenus TaxID=7906 RepID=A0A444UKR5_ACIRT|nr:Rap1 GTPase-GDP dissociation stimulator 1-A [Acipenser ruthenus]